MAVKRDPRLSRLGLGLGFRVYGIRVIRDPRLSRRPAIPVDSKRDRTLNQTEAPEEVENIRHVGAIRESSELHLWMLRGRRGLQHGLGFRV